MSNIASPVEKQEAPCLQAGEDVTDNKLVRISSNPEYLWDASVYPQGNHVITVHAIANDYLAGVSQINVNIGQTSCPTPSCNIVINLG